MLRRVPVSAVGFGVAALSLMLLASVALLMTPASQPLPATGCAQYTPSVVDASVVFASYDEGSSRIDVVDLRTGQARRLTAAAAPACWNPDMSGSVAVWEDRSRSDGEIVICDLDRAETARIPTSGATVDAEPAIWGDTVVFTRRSGLSSLIYVHRLDTGAQAPLTYALGEQSGPDIFENTVVFCYRDDIYVADVRTGVPRPLVQRSGVQDQPSIYGSLVAYADWDGTLADIRLYDLSTGEDRVVVGGPSVQYAPSVYGRTLAFEQYTAGSPHDTRVMVVELPEELASDTRALDDAAAEDRPVSAGGRASASRPGVNRAGDSTPARTLPRLGEISPCLSSPIIFTLTSEQASGAPAIAAPTPS